MPKLFRELALEMYRTATLGQRAAMNAAFHKNDSYPAAILFYHRVADAFPNPWSVSCSNFAQHMDWIAAHAEFASMAEMIQGQQDGTRTKLMVHITFDDAYGENCEFAIPELVRRRIPTTYFVATSFVESGRSFPHDLSRGKPLRPNTKAEIGQMASQGIVIGAHSHTHLDFGQDLPHSILVSEIRDVRKKLQDWTGQSIDYFAFPYGQVKNISQAALDMVFASGYQVAVSAYGGFNFPGGDDRHLQRIHGDPGMAALKNWLTFDPRKMRKRIRFPFDTSKHPLPFESSLSADRPENAMQLSTPS